MNIREKAILGLGGKCQECNTEDNLQLHHITYAEDSARWWESGESHKRAKEAFEHPERFELICKDCHLKIHENDPDNKMFVKMPAEEKEALRKSLRVAKKTGKTRRLTKYEVEWVDAVIKRQASWKHRLAKSFKFLKH